MTKHDGTTLRRVVTGHDANGRSIIIHDGVPAETLLWDAGGLHEIWSDAGGTIDRKDAADRGAGPVVLEPGAGGVKVRWFVVEPFPAGTSASDHLAAMNEAFDAMGGDSSRVDIAAHPGMHLTRTMDVIMVQSGRIRLILENGETILGPGDVVIQRGTNHAWEAVGEEPAVCLGVLIDRDLLN